jgi:hypothetical protein
VAVNTIDIIIEELQRQDIEWMGQIISHRSVAIDGHIDLVALAAAIDAVPRCLRIFRDGTTFPFLKIAREHGVDYRDVLAFEAVAHLIDARAPWEHAVWRAVRAEGVRRIRF